MKTLFLMALMLIFAPLESRAALAPWWYEHNVLQAGLEQDPCLKVGDPQFYDAAPGMKAWRITVTACTDQKAAAWNLIIADGQKVQFAGPSGVDEPAKITGATKTERLASFRGFLETALGSNPLFSDVVVTPCNGASFGCLYPYEITLEFKPVGVQAFVDDIHELHGRKNWLAQNYFEEILNLKADPEIAVTATSSKAGADLQ